MKCHRSNIRWNLRACGKTAWGMKMCGKIWGLWRPSSRWHDNLGVRRYVGNRSQVGTVSTFRHCKNVASLLNCMQLLTFTFPKYTNIGHIFLKLYTVHFSSKCSTNRHMHFSNNLLITFCSSYMFRRMYVRHHQGAFLLCVLLSYI
jgi:hypothetical protein